MKWWPIGLMTVGILATLFIFQSVSYGSIPQNTKVTTYIVRQHDTLWTIAEHFDPHDNTEQAIQWIEQKNHLSDNAYLQIGQALIVPVGR